MTDQKDHLPIKQAVDNTLSGLNGTPFLFERLAAQAAEQKEGEKNMKFKSLIVIALIALMCLSVAVASELLSGTVDWDGHATLETSPMPTSQPLQMPSTELDRAACKTLFMAEQQAENGETVVIYDLETRTEEWRDVTFSTNNEAEFRALLTNSGMRLPDEAPEGYAFLSGCIVYSCKPGGKYKLVDYADSGEGYLAVTYFLAEEDRLPTQYDILYAKENPEDPQNHFQLSVWAMKLDTAENVKQGLWDAQVVQTVNVPGMEKALCVVDAHAAQLTMYEKLPEMESCLSIHQNGLEAMHDVFYSVRGPVTESELLALFGGK